MRPIHMTIGERHLVRHDFPGGVRVTLEDTGRERGPAVRPALGTDTGGESGEARKADWPSGLMAGPSEGQPPAGGGAARETNYFSAAALKQRSDEAAAEIFRPLNPLIVGLALGALVLAAAFTTVSLARLDRQFEQEQV